MVPAWTGTASMSDPSLPPAAVEITALRRASEAARPERMPRRAVAGIGLVIAVAVLTVVGALVLDGSASRAVVAVGIVIALAVAAGLVMRPLQLAAARSRRTAAAVAAALDSTVEAVVSHVASIGYRVPAEVAAEWVTSPESTATAPLVHDSVIAARWWRPADGDDRVFVEPYLRQDGVASSLPQLPPLA